MATHSNILAWRIPWTVEPGELQSMGSQRVGHDCMTNTFTFIEEQLYYFARQKGSQQVNALKGVCPDMKGLVRSFLVMIQRGGHGQFMDILLMSWW